MQYNDHQLKAINSHDVNNLVLAGPGSGKTAVLVERIVTLVDRGIGSQDIVAITYTNAAANEMQQRLADIRLGYLGTIHGYILKLLRLWGAKCLELPERLAVIDEDQTIELLNAVCDDFRYRGNRRELQDAIRSIPEQKHTREELVVAEFWHRQRVNGLLSFDAVLEFGMLLIKKLAVQSIRVCDVLLVDEYQDTSYQIHCILTSLPCKERFFVGDPDQAIYGFTGGRVTNIVSLAMDPAWVVTFLETNYRCAASICETAQQLIEHNKRRVAKATICGTGVEGTVDLWSNLPSDEHEYFQVAREILDKEHGTVAVLARTKFICQRVCIALEGRGVSVRRREHLNRPPDWSLVRKLIAALCNPENDYLAYWLLLETKGRRFADQIKLAAAENLTTINKMGAHIASNVSPAKVPDVLASLVGASAQSIERINNAVRMLREGDGLPELAMAIEAPEVHERETGEGVTVTTMHAAKGREWDWVFIVGVDKDILPQTKADSDKEEERRLLYVAITRARMRCVVSTANRRLVGKWQQGPSPAEPSPFFAEIQ